jgi:transposase
MNVKYQVDLDQGEREQLRSLSSGGKIAVRRLKRVQILLAADAGIDDDSMAESLGLSGSTIYRTKRRFVEAGLEAALDE